MKMKRIISIILALSVLTVAGAFNLSVSADALINASKTCSITVHKYIGDNHLSNAEWKVTGYTVQNISNEFTPLAGITFKATLLDGDGNKTSTVKTFPATDSNGTAKITGLKQGKWYVEELPAPETVASSAVPAVVTLPFTNETGTDWLYDAHLYPKNEDIDIVKDVQHLGNDHHTADYNEVHTWIVTADLPEDIAPYTITDANQVTHSYDGYSKYSITDTIDRRLSYVRKATKVYVVANSDGDEVQGTELLLVEKQDYYLSYIDEAGKADSTLEVSLTQEGMKKVSPYNGTAFTGDTKAEKIRIYYNTYIRPTYTNDNGEVVATELATEIPNKAELTFTNSFGTTGTRDSDIPEVHTGGIAIYKYDSKTNKPLAGAQFKIALSEADAKNKVFVKARNQDGTLSSDDYVITTGKDGYAMFEGFDYGNGASKQGATPKVLGDTVTDGKTTYYLVEVKAPVNENGDSYQLCGEVIAVDCNATSHLTKNAVKIANNPPTYVPTGGIGDYIYGIIGVTVIGISAIGLVLFLTKKKRAQN